MTYPHSPTPPPVDDTPPEHVPVDERPPYGDPPRWRRIALVAGLLFALAVAVFLTWRLLRWLARLLFTYEAPSRREAQLIVPDDGRSYAGVVYRLRFFDGALPQLTDTDWEIVLDLHAPGARGQMRGAALELQQRVQQRDGQMCWQPRVQVVDAAGRVVGEWP